MALRHASAFFYAYFYLQRNAFHPRSLFVTVLFVNTIYCVLFRGVLDVEFTLPDASAALIEVLDVRGRRVRILYDAWTPPGRHTAKWDGTDPSGRPVADGVYLLRLRASGDVRSTKVVKVR